MRTRVERLHVARDVARDGLVYTQTTEVRNSYYCSAIFYYRHHRGQLRVFRRV